MKIQIGSRVAYSVQFLKSIGCSHDPMAHARGLVTEIKPFSGGKMNLACITWDKGEFPALVNVKNLAIVGPNSRFANCD